MQVPVINSGILVHGELDKSLVDRESKRDCEEYQESQNWHLTVVELLYAHHHDLECPLPFGHWSDPPCKGNCKVELNQI